MTRYNEYLHEKDQRAIKRFLTCSDYNEIARLCNVSYSTVNNIVCRRVKVMRHNYKVYIMLVNKALMELEENDIMYRNHLKYILK